MADGQSPQPNPQPQPQQSPAVLKYLNYINSIVQQNPGMTPQQAVQATTIPSYKGPSGWGAIGSDIGQIGHALENLRVGIPFTNLGATPESLWQGQNAPPPPKWSMGGGGGSGGGGTTQPTTDPTQTTQPSDTSTPTTSPIDDALTMGMNMFFSQYLAPMIAQQNQANTSMIQQYGNAMQQAMGPGGSNLPPEARAIMQAQVPQTQQTLQMLNQAGNQMALGAIPYQSFLQGVGGLTTEEQALQQALTHAATYSAIQSNPSLVSNILQQGLAGVPFGQYAEMIGAGGGVAGISGVTPTGTTGTTTPTTGGTAVNPQVQAMVQQLQSNPQALTGLVQGLLAQGG